MVRRTGIYGPRRNRNLKMEKPFCHKCGKGMYRIGVDIDTSCGLQTTEYQCFSLNNHHRVGIVERIPGWNEFRNEKTETARLKTEKQRVSSGRRMTERQRLKIRSMLAKSIRGSEISKKTGFSPTIVYRIKGVTLLAAMGTAIRRKK